MPAQRRWRILEHNFVSRCSRGNTAADCGARRRARWIARAIASAVPGYAHRSRVMHRPPQGALQRTA